MRLEDLSIRLAPVRGSATANTCMCVCVSEERANGCQCWGIGGEDRAKGAGWTNLAAPKVRADDAKGGESDRRRCGSREVKLVGPAGAAWDWESRGWTEGPGARAARKRVRPSTASASPRGDRAHAFLAGSQKSAGARLALERIIPSLSRFSPVLPSPPLPLLSTRLFLRARRDLALVRGPRKGRVKGRIAGAAAAAATFPSLYRAAHCAAPSRLRETIASERRPNEFSEATDCYSLTLRFVGCMSLKILTCLSLARSSNFGFLVLRYIERPKGVVWENACAFFAKQFFLIDEFTEFMNIPDFYRFLIIF